MPLAFTQEDFLVLKYLRSAKPLSVFPTVQFRNGGNVNGCDETG